MPHFTWLPANQAATEDVEAIFATGGARKCRCQALKVPGWIWRDTTQEQRDAALLEQTACGTAGPTSGLIGYVDGVNATVEYGEQVGARVLEGYPIEPPPGKTVIWDEASVGLLQVFLEAGYEVVASPTLRRRVVRRQLTNRS